MRTVLLLLLVVVAGCSAVTYRTLECVVVVMRVDSAQVDTLGWEPPECEALCSSGRCEP